MVRWRADVPEWVPGLASLARDDAKEENGRARLCVGGFPNSGGFPITHLRARHPGHAAKPREPGSIP